MSDVIWMVKVSDSNLQLVLKAFTHQKSYFKSILSNK